MKKNENIQNRFKRLLTELLFLSLAYMFIALQYAIATKAAQKAVKYLRKIRFVRCLKWDIASNAIFITCGDLPLFKPKQPYAMSFMEVFFRLKQNSIVVCKVKTNKTTQTRRQEETNERIKKHFHENQLTNGT